MQRNKNIAVSLFPRLYVVNIDEIQQIIPFCEYIFTTQRMCDVRIMLRHGLSVCLSARLFVTRRYFVETAEMLSNFSIPLIARRI